jgi:cytochrome P450
VQTDEQLGAAAARVVEMQQFLQRRFEERRESPQEDLISALVHAEVEDGVPLSDHELQAIMRQLVTGGFDTVTNSLSNGLWLLLRHPDQLAKLRERPELVGAFVEEALRFETPVQGLLRRTTRDVVVAGTTIPKGAVVIPRYGAANRDAGKFPCPHQFDIERRNASAHLAFGMGIHFCVGRPLARAELLIAFGKLIERLQDLALAAPLPDPPHSPSLMFHPLKELRISFRPAVPA